MSPRSKEASAKMRAASRAALLEAARHLFSEQGFFNTKVVEIADRAGMSPGNLYLYFAGKDELLQAVLADGFAALAASLQAAAEHPGTRRQKLIHLIEAYLAFERERGDFTRLLMSLFGHGGAPLLQQLGFDLQQIGAGYHQRLIQILAHPEEETAAPAAEPEVLAMFFFAFFNGLSITYGEDWLSIPAEVIRDGAMRLLGVGPGR